MNSLPILHATLRAQTIPELHIQNNNHNQLQHSRKPHMQNHNNKTLINNYSHSFQPMSHAWQDELDLNIPSSNMTALIPKAAPSLLNNHYLPGPLCMQKLSGYGAVSSISNESVYIKQQGDSPLGRSKILQKMIHNQSIVCADTAAWIWLGGTFPNTLDIISSSHFRTKREGHAIHAYNRKLSNNDYAHIGKLRVTTPQRTICDIALSAYDNQYQQIERKKQVAQLIGEYRIKADKCMQSLESQHLCPGSIQARIWLMSILNGYFHTDSDRTILDLLSTLPEKPNETCL